MQELASLDIEAIKQFAFKRLGAWGNSWFTTLAKSGT